MERLWMVPSYMILTLIVLGTLGAFTGVVSPFRGFSLVFLGIVTSVVFGIALAGAAAFASATGKSWRPRALRASIIPLLVAIPAFIAVNMSSVPTMNDVSTDLSERLEFDPELAALRTSEEPGEEQRAHFDTLQKQAYPDLAPIGVALPPDQAFAQAKQAAESLPGWQVTGADAATGRIEATDTSRIFHFVDDVVIRVRPDGAGSRIDIRSRSRDGLGDMGVNATRVRSYAEAVKKQGS
ncbi:MAG: DUF1499 domain-containing protein [Myxococcota bacterium]